MHKHIFISYPWANQNQLVAVAIQQKLESIGYRVWIDLNEMSGDMTQKMIDAINNSSIVIALISPEYEKSENCQKEYKFSQRRKKIIQHVVTTKGFQVGEQDDSQTHWLAFLMPADVLYHRIYKELLMGDKPKFDEMVDKFVEHIQRHYSDELEEAFDKFGISSKKSGILRGVKKIQPDSEVCREFLLSTASNEINNVKHIVENFDNEFLKKSIWRDMKVVYKNKSYTGLDGRSWFSNMNALDFCGLWGSVEMFKILELVFPFENIKERTSNFAKSKSIFNDNFYANAYLLACSNDNLEVVEHIISKYPEIKFCSDRDGCNALHLSAWLGGIKVAKYLVKKQGFEIEDSGNKKKWNSVLCACRGGKYEQLKFFLEQKPKLITSVDDSGDGVLEIAKGYSKDDRVLQLLVDKLDI